jgi:hypothetical protein
VVRGALFKRIEEEKGLGGWAPAPRRGIRTVGITDSAICLDMTRIYQEARQQVGIAAGIARMPAAAGAGA